MNAILRRTVRGAAAGRAKQSKIDMSAFRAGLVEGFQAAFAVCVLLGALWILVSGYA